jgi:hypothetical protein
MKYVYGNMTGITPKHLVIINKFQGELRNNATETKFIVKVPTEYLKYFEDFEQVDLLEARAFLASSAWTGQTWYNNLFGG